MNIESVQSFFMWCTIINGAMLMLSAIMLTFARDWIYRIHSKWFQIPRTAFEVAIYSFIGIFKIFFLMFNLVPYLALLAMK